jgi:Cd2+/Zn2+-exporting ATPase
MDCAEEVSILKQAVGPVVGGAEWLAFDVLNGRMIVADAARRVPDHVIVDAIAATG